MFHGTDPSNCYCPSITGTKSTFGTGCILGTKSTFGTKSAGVSDCSDWGGGTQRTHRTPRHARRGAPACAPSPPNVGKSGFLGLMGLVVEWWGHYDTPTMDCGLRTLSVVAEAWYNA